MQTAANVSNAKPNKAGAIWFAPEGTVTSLPSDYSTAIDTTVFKCLGYVSDDGLSNDNSPSSETQKAWGGDTVLNLQTERPDSFGFKLIESRNENVLAAIYGSKNVAVSAAEGTVGDITVKATADDMPRGVFVIDMIMKANKKKRIVIPDGSISSLGTINYKDNEAIGYDVTVTDVPDSYGVYHYEYIQA